MLVVKAITSSTVGYAPRWESAVHDAPSTGLGAAIAGPSTRDTGRRASKGKSTKNWRRIRSASYTIGTERSLGSRYCLTWWVRVWPSRRSSTRTGGRSSYLSDAPGRARAPTCRGGVTGGGLASTGAYHVGGASTSVDWSSRDMAAGTCVASLRGMAIGRVGRVLECCWLCARCCKSRRCQESHLGRRGLRRWIGG